jgi:hypothetical protein
MSGSAKAGTIAEKATHASCGFCQSPFVRAPPKRASGEIFFSLTKTYMDVGYTEVGKPFISILCANCVPDSEDTQIRESGNLTCGRSAGSYLGAAWILIVCNQVRASCGPDFMC